MRPGKRPSSGGKKEKVEKEENTGADSEAGEQKEVTMDDEEEGDEGGKQGDNPQQQPPRRYFADARRKAWRLIIRNLPFSTKREDMQVACCKYGPFTELVMPKCKDKRFPDSCAGYCFVQFKNKKDAEEARNLLNMSEINGRKVAVDWALPKDTYETANFEEKEQEKRNKAEEVKSKDDEEKISAKEQKEFVEKHEESDTDEEESEDDEEEEDSEEELIDEETSRVKKPGKSNGKTEPRKEDVAVAEGRVVFVRNLSFEVDDDTLKEALEKYGEIKLAIICRYGDNGHSKGSAFVHFATCEEADACINAFETDPGISINGRRAYGHRAIPRNEAVTKEKERQQKKPKDRRNLHLLRVGIVRPGTASARGISDADTQKRAKLALAARAKLQNLHMFVSPVRLVVHNLPTSLTDKAFKSLCFLAAGNPDARITECRIWRDRERLTAGGVPKSRGFGFVAFSEHSDALAALRSLNNNPSTFTNEKRPIVEFSIENLSVVRLRERRLEKSKKKESGEGSAKDLSEKTRRELAETKAEMSSGGRKPLPSHFGPKVRHRDLKGKSSVKEKDSASKTGKKRKMKGMGVDAREAVPSKKTKKIKGNGSGKNRAGSGKNRAAPGKKPVGGRSKQLTKFLTLSG